MFEYHLALTALILTSIYQYHQIYVVEYIEAFILYFNVCLVFLVIILQSLVKTDQH